ncbi:predicted protein [Nematostella vectensis]|uniref:Protein LLP homolog n=1 Tax=Nematostella vectensis TaxID=45351 RepID=A7RFB8_NEMVE|nr:protein LLP homolog [Nematostella vectensis]EDO49929.1 predicted protein [Nematostella vectensis]|eukprot:XP_001641992.1 predicted protein [Nematostella vectensis]
MAKSLRSKWKRKMRAEKRKKNKEKVKQKLLDMVGTTDIVKDVTMAENTSTPEKQSNVKGNNIEHVEKVTANNEETMAMDSAGDVDMGEEKRVTTKSKYVKKKKFKSKKTMKRLGNKKRRGKTAFKW